MHLVASPLQVTISTVGLVPEMRQVVARTRVQMALSLHATTGGSWRVGCATLRVSFGLGQYATPCGALWSIRRHA